MDESGLKPGNGELPPSVKMQILATEHWGLLASRTMIWNEIFSRASMFFTLLSAAVVALALVAQATDFGENFTIFALLLLPVVILTGLFTFLRLNVANNFDMLQVVGMNRIRHAYLEMAPELEPYFITSSHDDLAGVQQSAGFSRPRLVYMLASTPFLVGVVDAIVMGALVGLILDVADLNRIVCAIGGAIGAVAFLALLMNWARRDLRRTINQYQPKFPSPPAGS
jgi:hypothetical protein